LSDRREYDRIDSEIGRVSKSSDPFAATVRATRISSTIASSRPRREWPLPVEIARQIPVE
jgi:hypothetical protein